jgi:hypothetical protein
MTEKLRKKGKNAGDEKKVTPVAPDHVKGKLSDVAMQDLLGEKLRAYYDQFAREPVPDRFTVLLKQLEARGVPKKTS